MIRLPEHILKQIHDWGLENNIGSGSAFGDTFGVMIFGAKGQTANIVAISAAQALLAGVLENAWDMVQKAADDAKEGVINDPPSGRTH